MLILCNPVHFDPFARKILAIWQPLSVLLRIAMSNVDRSPIRITCDTDAVIRSSVGGG